MEDFENTAKDELNSEEDKKCGYYNECYLQVRNGGMCLYKCPDRTHHQNLRSETMKYCDMDNTEIRKIIYEQCPLKCTGCEALCNEMPVNQCRKNLSQEFDKKR